MVVVDVVVVAAVDVGLLNRDGARETTGAIVVGTSVVVMSLLTVVMNISSESLSGSTVVVVVDTDELVGRFLRTLRVRVDDDLGWLAHGTLAG